MSEHRHPLVVAMAATSVAFHIWLIFSGLIPNLVSRPLHLLLALPWVFGVGVRGTAATRAVAAAIGVAGAAACIAVIVLRERLLDQYGSLVGAWQFVLAAVLLLVVLDMARRAVKPILPAVAVAVLAYGLLGDAIPGHWGHDPPPLDSFLGTLTIAEGGLWGELTGISATTVAPFLVLGALVAAGDAGEGFMALSKKLAGRYRAGSAKVEVVASALYGTISGSASANVASTGTITIPNMIRMGYPRQFAAAVEAVASSGGQIMPPVMGAGAFLMAEMLRVTYADIMVAAALPALLFFVAAWIGCHVYGHRLGLLGLPPEELPGWAHVARTAPFFLAPFGTLVTLLATTDMTPQFACVYAIVVAIVLLLIDDRGRVDLRRFAGRLARAAVDAAEQTAMIAAVIVCASIIVGVLQMTGLGVKITSAILSTAGDQVWLALALTAAACLALGMEVPTTAAFVICISVAGPALQRLGVPALDSHMFVFWYALLSTITPPVCGAVYIAAGIADTPWLPVAGTAMRLGIGLFWLPPAFIANPSLLRPDENLLLAVAAALKIGTAIALVSYAAIGTGPGRVAQRLVAAAAGAVLTFAIPL
ncbi:MAG: TRAP transporter fused permease subunit [Alphaproteobacteria bacterium]|nr:TRAP transporter fused permease subunit [Alphaproteobacteria bacterium]